MHAPHISVLPIHSDDAGQNSKGESGLYLVSPATPTRNSEQEKIQFLEAKLHDATYEIARLKATLLQKEQLLQNFRVREYELKAAYLQALA